jgi:hypothetical protein
LSAVGAKPMADAVELLSVVQEFKASITTVAQFGRQLPHRNSRKVIIDPASQAYFNNIALRFQFHMYTASRLMNVSLTMLRLRSINSWHV